jgi:hypothetical protein
MPTSGALVAMLVVRFVAADARHATATLFANLARMG